MAGSDSTYPVVDLMCYVYVCMYIVNHAPYMDIDKSFTHISYYVLAAWKYGSALYYINPGYC